MDFFKSSEVENKDTSSGKNVFSDAFVDKMSDDFKKAQEVCEASNEIVDSFHYLPEKELTDETVFVDKLPWRKRSIPTHSEWLYPLTFDAGKGLKEA